jgi:hypothetical protein
MTVQPPAGRPQTTPPPRPRPVDVDTAFWLWLTALVLLVIGQIADAFTAPTPVDRGLVIGVAVFVSLTIGAVIGSLLFLVRSGYRWSRTALTAGGVVTIFYTVASLFGFPRETVGAVIFAVTGIVGSVLIGGGIFLMHRPDSHRYFDR